jgi:3-dehydroquinate synthase
LNYSSDVLDVNLGDRSYPIYIGRDLLSTGDELRRHVKSKKALIVTNTKVAPLYLERVKNSLQKGGIEVFDVILPDGEEYKNMDVLMMILDKYVFVFISAF